MISEIKVYQLTPEQVAAYTPGMDLGEPIRIVQPESMIKKDGTYKSNILRGAAAMRHRGRKGYPI